MGKTKDKKSINPNLALLFRVVILICWIAAPMILNDSCQKRGVVIPKDIMTAVYAVWYVVGAGFYWYINKDEFGQRRNQKNISYTKNTNDWFDNP